MDCVKLCCIILCSWSVQLEQTEWDSVNKLLQHHGFKPVHFADPIENKNLSGRLTAKADLSFYKIMEWNYTKL